MNPGDRVRVVDEESLEHGREGTVVQATDSGYIVRIDGEPFVRFYDQSTRTWTPNG